MLKDKPIDISQTNMALFGTDIEKEIKKHAAQGEPAWKTAGKQEGNEIWRVEKFKIVSWPKNQYGAFFDGDSYILLHTKKVEGKLSWDVHFWLGTFTTQDEAGTAAYKTVELDDFLGGYPVQHREVQGYEGDMFHEYFPNGIKILKGGVDTGFHHVEHAPHANRLLQLKGKVHKVVVRPVPMSADSLNSGDVFVLDADKEVYMFIGKTAGIGEKTKGTQLTRALDDERGGQVNIHVMNEHEMNGTDDLTNKFWALLGGRVSSIKSAAAGGSDDSIKENRRLVKISDESGSVKTTDVEFSMGNLSSKDCFIIDVGAEIFVWIGLGASENERKSAMVYGQKYLSDQGKPPHLPITRIMEGCEGELLSGYFKN